MYTRSPRARSLKPSDRPTQRLLASQDVSSRPASTLMRLGSRGPIGVRTLPGAPEERPLQPPVLAVTQPRPTG